MQGKFIVLYGANNLGKSEQCKRLADNLAGNDVPYVRIKYPLYNLKPTGPLINSIIRPKDEIKIPMEPLELQKIYAQNRRDGQPIITRILKSGVSVLAEDYTGTGISWGLTEGVSLEELETINADLIKPDISILLDGERFSSGVEAKHRFESGEWNKARENHLFLAERYDWKKVNANQSKEKVAEDIWNIVSSS